MSKKKPTATIDNQDEVRELIEKIEEHLPISVEIHRNQARMLHSQGVPLPPHRLVQIYSVLNGGDEGGILCSISPKDSKKVTLVSLTHLKVNSRHPLFKEIRAYQKKRKKELKKRGRVSGYSEITP